MSDGDPRGRTWAWLGARSRETLHAEAARHRSWGWATSALEEHVRAHRRDWADAFGRLLSVDEVRKLSGVVRAKPERVYVEIDARGQVTLLWIRGVVGRDARIVVATRQRSVRTCFPFVPARKIGAWLARHPGMVEGD